MKTDVHELGRVIAGMRRAYELGDNAMAWARANSTGKDNSIASTLVAYDLQAGSYVANARANPNYINAWCERISELIKPYLEAGDRVLEVGVGEATTLAGVIKEFNCSEIISFGFDVSWSRIKVAQQWVEESAIDARLFVGDLFCIPLADNSIDVIYTSHSLEPNGGQEVAAIKELLRVARKAVVLVEPIYELASELAQKRMAEHGYVRGLKSVAELLGAKVVEYRLLDICSNPLNPSGVVLIAKPHPAPKTDIKLVWSGWQCPLTGTPLAEQGDIFYAEQVGIAYPVLRGVPLLRADHGVVASQINVGINPN